jgi:hypothetical protein
MRTGVEEAKKVVYSLECIGVPLPETALLLSDSQSVLHTTTMAKNSLKKRHMLIHYHAVREAVAAKFIVTCKIDTKLNLSDIGTKALSRLIFERLCAWLVFDFILNGDEEVG